MTQECHHREWLGKNISHLVFSRNVLNADELALHMITKVMVFDVDVFGAGAHSGSG